jgi:hypothetical protein
MITTEKPARGIWLGTRDAVPLLLFVLALWLATLTLWVPAYWPVALFEISTFLLTAVTLVLGRVPARGTYLPLFALGFVVLWGCFQLITGFTIDRFATERATLQWMTWLAVYYLGVSTVKDKSVANLLRTSIVWFGFAVALEAILQAYLSPGKVFGLFPTGYRDFVMGPIVYHTHFAALIETILPIALFLALREAAESYTFLVISAVFLTALVVSASRGGLLIGFAEVVGVLLLSHVQKAKVGRRIWFAALALAGATGVLTLIVGFETASARFSSGALTAGPLHAAYDSRAALDWLGTGILAGGVSRLRHNRSRSHRQSGPLRLAAVDGGRGLARRTSHALSCTLGGKAGDSIDLGNRRDRRLDPCVVRLPVFAPGGRGMADFDAFHGSHPANGESARNWRLTQPTPD